MSILTDNFEELKICGIFNLTSLEMEMPLLSVDFGDGYGAGILSGLPSGLRSWGITADVLPDTDDYLVTYSVNGQTLTATRFKYFWDFYRRHLALGNKPFYFRDPQTENLFLASFAESKLSFEVFTAKILAGGIKINQRRAKIVGLDFRVEDGSLDIDLTVPTNPIMQAPSPTATTVTWKWLAASDNVGVAGYELQIATDVAFTQNLRTINLGVVAQYSDTGLTTNQQYFARTRAKDAAGNVSGWSQAVSATPKPNWEYLNSTYFSLDAEENIIVNSTQNNYDESARTAAVLDLINVGDYWDIQLWGNTFNSIFSYSEIWVWRHDGGYGGGRISQGNTWTDYSGGSSGGFAQLMSSDILRIEKIAGHFLRLSRYGTPFFTTTSAFPYPMQIKFTTAYTPVGVINKPILYKA